MRCTTPAALARAASCPSYILASPIVGLQSPLATAEPIPGFGQPPISPNKTCQRTLFSAKHSHGVEVAQGAPAQAINTSCG